ncbi:WD repeat-containing protein 27 [Periophthalmus magnuspinnatus]|uniref:WD repeat-containing protein 27 n=1 Tax=Periophthalmus magnuspinnatus TaxID=409849 RepID=UPI0024368C17|nr:WD repeat-containing protein 27 [Periophthalmus magnuspinnatus]
MITEKFCLTRDRLVLHQQLACYQSFCAILNGKDILVYYHMDMKKLQLQLTGHHSDISVMTFGKGNKPVLCSASNDYLIVWDIESCQRRAREGKIPVGTVIGTLVGEVIHLSFSSADDKVAACTLDTVYVLNSKKQETISSLTGHLGSLTSAEFCSWNNNILVTTSEDRTFKVWDLQTESVNYQSFVLSGSPLISVIFLPETQQFCIGSLDGQVWCFSLTNVEKCHLVTKTDLQKVEKRFRILQESLGQQAGGTIQCPSEVETAKPILKMELSSLTDTDEKKSWICIGSTNSLYMLDLATAELLTVLYFKDYPELSITMAGAYSTSVSQADNSILLFVSSLFTPCLSLLEINICDLQKTWVKGEGLSVFPSSPPLPESPLNAQLKKKDVSIPKKKAGIKDQSLVFNTKVKSSGYTSAPRRVMFTSKTNVKKGLPSKTTNAKRFKVQDYPDDCTVPTLSRKEFVTSSKPVYTMEYSGDGKQVLCGLGDCSVLLCRSSLTGKPTVYTGHDKAVSSVSWSLSRQWWLSASEDQTLRIWTHKSPEPAIVMGNKAFSKPIRRAQFYYLDKFILVASGRLLHMYLYDIDTNHDDIKRYQQHSAVKLATSLSISATEITALSSANDFLSYIVLVCGSDRSIQMFDMNRGAVAAELPDAHSRAVHCITQNKGSLFSVQASDSYNLFLTSAVTDGIKIWDLRSLRCVRRYENHVNRCHSCSCALSPCGHYIATGSEDNCAYVYDVRSSSYLHKLHKESSPVLSVVFNPSTPELLTGTLDGRLRLFQPSTGQCLSSNTSTVA